MAHEIEIKLRIKDLEALRAALKKLGARSISAGTGCVHEWNVLFDTPRGNLAKRGHLLRIRTETVEGLGGKGSARNAQRVLVTYKRPVARHGSTTGSSRRLETHKVREEIELEVADGGALARIFDGLGMRGWFRYEKFRTTFRLPPARHWAKGLLIELDETPIGNIVELEGPPKAIDKAARELGFSKRDYILMNYLSLYREECRRRGEKPGDMVFQKGNERVAVVRAKNLPKTPFFS